ncbi:MAG: amidase family protein [Thermomicrobiales bacterium]
MKGNRRAFLAGAAGMLAAGTTRRASAQIEVAPPAGNTPRRPLDMRPFVDALGHFTPETRTRLDGLIREASIPAMQDDLQAGRYSSVDLVTYYLDRIRRFDITGLHSLLDLNPDILDIAATHDSERSQGHLRGPLHGIPVLLKDNIGSGDQMRTTAGAAALGAARCDRDAHLVSGLRNAGGMMLGKTNLSEWAYWMSYIAPSGFSALGGQTLCPYGAAIDPVGSSTGSAVAMTANLAALSVGTETAGSIVAPSSRASVVGMRPTLGLVSRDRVLPISDECDMAGPIGRTVSDVALALTAMASAPDPRDRQSPRAAGVHGTDFFARLDHNALHGKRVGIIGIELTGPADDEWVIANSGLSATADALRRAGAQLAVVRAAPFDFSGPGFVGEFNFGMREGVNAYLRATNAPMGSLADIIAFNDEDPGRFAPWGQDRLRDCLWSPLGESEARLIARGNRQQARAYLTGLLDGQDLDVLVGIDTLQSLIYPFAGFPAIAMPGGLSPWGVPFSATFIGRPREDAALLSMAYAFEQAGPLRVAPELPGDLPLRWSAMPAHPGRRIARLSRL